MSVTIKFTDDFGERELPSAGPQHAMCFAVIDLGVHPGGIFQGKQAPARRQIAIGFELEERITSGPFQGQRHARYLQLAIPQGPSGKSGLEKLLKDWLGIALGECDLEEVCVGRPAMVTVRHEHGRKETNKNKTFANISNVTPPLRTFTPWVLENGKKGRNSNNWRYPKYYMKMRDEAISPPEDKGSEWEPNVEPSNPPSFPPITTEGEPPSSLGRPEDDKV